MVCLETCILISAAFGSRRVNTVIKTEGNVTNFRETTCGKEWERVQFYYSVILKKLPVWAAVRIKTL